MNILGFILGKRDSLEAVPASSFDFSNFPSFLEQEGAFVIYGTGREMNRFYHKTDFTGRPRPFFIKRFALLTGDMDNIITAIPLDSRKVLDLALSAICLAKRPSFKKRFMISVFKALNLPFFYRFVFRRQFCLVVTDKKETFFSFLSQEVDVPDIKLSFSIYKSSGKFILPVFDLKTGEALSYAKIYSEEAKERGENEARALRFLEEFDFENAEPPHLIFSGYWGEHLVNVISTKSRLSNFKRATEAHIVWIRELAEKTGKKMKFEDSLFAKEIKKEVEFIRSKLNNNDFELVKYFYNKATKSLSGKEFIFSFVNKEFDYHELLHHKNKNLVIDWEHAREEFPPLFDVFSTLLSESEGWLQDLEAIFFHKNKKSGRIIGEFLREWGISGEDAYFMLLLFLFDRLSASSEKDTEIILQFLKRAHYNESIHKRSWFNN